MRFFILAIVLTGLVACQNQEEEALPEQENKSPTIQVEDSDPVPKDQNMRGNKRAKHLASVARKVPDVNRSTAVIAGPYVVVGIDVDKDLDRSRVGSIKYSVAEALKKDPYGKNAVVIADADGFERIKEMGRKMRQGYPIQGITDELAAIVGRYMPEVPIRQNRPSEGDQNKKTIPEQQEQDLDQMQNDQSNNYKNKTP